MGRKSLVLILLAAVVAAMVSGHYNSKQIDPYVSSCSWTRSLFSRPPKWKILQTAKDPSEQREVAIATYNRWNTGQNTVRRNEELERILDSSKAVIFCLQEVTQSAIRWLASRKGIAKKWIMSDFDGRTWTGSDGLVTLYRKNTAYPERIEDLFYKRSKQNRYAQISTVRLAVYPYSLKVVNVHLESLDSDNERQSQLEEIRDYLKLEPNPVFLVGDMNLISDDYQDIIPTMNAGSNKEWRDSCVELNDEFDTYGVFRPTELFADGSEVLYPPKRLDRIVYVGDEIVPFSAESFGNNAIRNALDDGDTLASDHLGVVVTFRQKSLIAR